jgi:hypothetical protein
MIPFSQYVKEVAGYDADPNIDAVHLDKQGRATHIVSHHGNHSIVSHIKGETIHHNVYAGTDRTKSLWHGTTIGDRFKGPSATSIIKNIKIHLAGHSDRLQHDHGLHKWK